MLPRPTGVATGQSATALLQQIGWENEPLRHGGAAVVPPAAVRARPVHGRPARGVVHVAAVGVEVVTVPPDARTAAVAGEVAAKGRGGAKVVPEAHGGVVAADLFGVCLYQTGDDFGVNQSRRCWPTRLKKNLVGVWVGFWGFGWGPWRPWSCRTPGAGGGSFTRTACAPCRAGARPCACGAAARAGGRHRTGRGARLRRGIGTATQARGGASRSLAGLAGSSGGRQGGRALIGGVCRSRGRTCRGAWPSTTGAGACRRPGTRGGATRQRGRGPSHGGKASGHLDEDRTAAGGVAGVVGGRPW